MTTECSFQIYHNDGLQTIDGSIIREVAQLSRDWEIEHQGGDTTRVPAVSEYEQTLQADCELSDRTIIVLATFVGTVVGYIVANSHRTDSATMALQDMYVGAEHRQMGIGRKLLNSLEDEAKQAGVTTVVAEIQTSEGRQLLLGSGYVSDSDDAIASHILTQE